MSAKNKYKSIIIYIVIATAIIVANLTSFGQSPTAASLGRFAQTQVSNYTGIPGISIPLGELKSKELSVPISLAYHAGGVRVSDESSWVGMGWAFNAGGMITRQVRGIPDETPERGYIYVSDHISDFENMDIEEKGRWAQWTNVGSRYSRIYGGEAAEEDKDGEPDIFYFNFLGRTGKFYLTSLHEDAIVIPYQKISIRPVIENDKIMYFNITDENGVKYRFGGEEAIEETRSRSLEVIVAKRGIYNELQNPVDGLRRLLIGESGEWYFEFDPDYLRYSEYTEYRNDTWYITEINSPFRTDQITFEYENAGTVTNLSSPRIEKQGLITATHQMQGALGLFPADFSDRNPFDDIASLRLKNNPLNEVPNGEPVIPSGNSFFLAASSQTNRYQINHSKTQTKTKRLSRIAASTGAYIQFTPTNTDRALRSVSIYNHIGDRIKKYNFDYYKITSEYWDNPELIEPLSLLELLFFKDANLDRQAALPDGSFDAPALATQLNRIPTDNERNFISLAFAKSNYQRLFLASVTEENQANLSPYQFVYDRPEKLPRKTSVLQDVFGRVQTDPILTTENNFKIQDKYGVYDAENMGDGTIGLLQKIVLPTGGYTQFEFEPHKPVNYKAFGARIKQITTYDKEENLASVQDYRYKNGQIAQRPVTIKFKRSIPMQTPAGRELKEAILCNYSINEIITTQGSQIGYAEVRVYNSLSKETVGGLGYEEFAYTHFGSHPNTPTTKYEIAYDTQAGEEDGRDVLILTARSIERSYDRQPYYPSKSNDEQRGLLLNHFVINEEDEVIQKTENAYQFEIEELRSISIGGLMSDNFGKVGYYTITSRPVLLSSSRTTIYDEDNPEISTQKTENYTYNEHLLPEEITTTTTSGDTLIQKIKYTLSDEYSFEEMLRNCFADFQNCNNECNILPTEAERIACSADCNQIPDGCAVQDPITSGLFELRRQEIGVPVEKINLKLTNGERYILGGEITHYQEVAEDIIRPIQKKSLQLAEPLPENEFNYSFISEEGNYIFDEAQYQESEATFVYNDHGQLIQTENREGKTSAKLFDPATNTPIAKASNAKHKQISATSFEPQIDEFPSEEDFFVTGNWAISLQEEDLESQIICDATAKTGNCYFTGRILFKSLINWSEGKHYKLSLWARSNNANSSILVSQQNRQEVPPDNEWHLLEFDLGQTNFVTVELIGESTQIDEIRLHPKDAEMVSYTTNPMVGITSENAPNNYITYYQYDAENRLINIVDHKKRLREKYEYYYADVPIVEAPNNSGLLSIIERESARNAEVCEEEYTECASRCRNEGDINNDRERCINDCQAQKANCIQGSN